MTCQQIVIIDGQQDRSNVMVVESVVKCFGFMRQMKNCDHELLVNQGQALAVAIRFIMTLYIKIGCFNTS